MERNQKLGANTPIDILSDLFMPKLEYEPKLERDSVYINYFEIKYKNPDNFQDEYSYQEDDSESEVDPQNCNR